MIVIHHSVFLHFFLYLNGIFLLEKWIFLALKKEKKKREVFMLLKKNFRQHKLWAERC